MIRPSAPGVKLACRIATYSLPIDQLAKPFATKQTLATDRGSCYTHRMPNDIRTRWDELALPFLRIRGRNLPAAQQVRHACREQSFAITPLDYNAPDQTMIDPALPLQEPGNAQGAPDPGYRPAFSTLSAEQRWVFWNWLRTHEDNVPVGYAILYLQHLEAALFDAHAEAALAEMRWLFSHHRALSVRESTAHAMAVGAWLHRQPDLYAWIINQVGSGSWNLEVLLSLQNDLGVPLSAVQVIRLGQFFRHSWSAWAKQHEREVEQAVVAELATAGQSILSQQVDALRAEQRTAQVQLVNPGIRFLVQAVDVWNSPAFQRAIKDLLESSARSAQLGGHFTSRSFAATAKPTQWVDRGWYLILEFGESSSEKLDRVVAIARRHPGFIRLLDENREIVYRNVYRHRDLSRFWTLFERVRNWKSTRVFINGNPVRTDELWPGAPELE